MVTDPKNFLSTFDRHADDDVTRANELCWLNYDPHKTKYLGLAFCDIFKPGLDSEVNQKWEQTNGGKKSSDKFGAKKIYVIWNFAKSNLETKMLPILVFLHNYLTNDQQT